MDFVSSLRPQQAMERRCQVVNSVRASFLFLRNVIRHLSLVVSKTADSERSIMKNMAEFGH